MDPLKSILYVLPSTVIGGAETRFFNIIKNMTGVRNILLTQKPVAEYFSNLNVKIYQFEEYGCCDPTSFSVKKTIKYAKAISDVFRKEKIDCIIGILHVGTFYASAAKDIFRLRKAVIGTILGNISAYFKSEARTQTLLERSLLWYLLRRPSAIIVPSEGVKNDLVENFGIDGRKIILIYNGIDINRVRTMAAAENLNIKDGYNGRTIVTACRLNAQKDFTTLLKAFKEVRDKIGARLIIVGGGELKDAIIRLAKELGIERDVVITGFQRNPFGFFNIADVFVLSSFFEGLPNSVLEAMALGVPVVVTDCPSGPGEIIQHGVNGFLIPAQDHHSMTKAILMLLKDEKLRKKIAAGGMERVKYFSFDNMVESFKQVILRSC
jgi:glycosyltransferase involved in cell wall biosynthesis